MSWRAPALLSLICVAIYSNTLFADFAFDDHLAVVDNKDVVDQNTPLTALLRHDFWGQDIAGLHSHKSYRPVTVLSFRLLARVAQHFTAQPQRKPSPDPSAPSDKPPPFGTAPFHVANIALHCAVTCAVYSFALRLSQTRESLSAGQQHAGGAAAAAQQQAAQQNLRRQHGSGKKDSAESSSSASASHAGKPALPPDSLRSCEAEALLAALLFAAHPVHTEAVAGIVGHAELLCAALFLAALAAYMQAVSGIYSEGSAAQWRLIAAALVLTMAAALTKEIGITVVVPMLLYDLLLSPVGHEARIQPCDRSSHLALRAAALAAVAAAYVGIRQAVTGGHQLVSVFRKVENPIAFVDSRLTRALSTGYLHARYFGLLLAPWRLSADWSFNCVPLVSSLDDPRNMLSAALYLLLACVACSAIRLLANTRPGRTSSCEGSSGGGSVKGSRTGRQARSGAAGYGSSSKTPGAAATAAAPAAATAAETAHALPSSDAAARWTVFVFLGLLAAPFLPSSNLLLYVGTFIGERLLYIPSIGFCMLLANLLIRVHDCLAAAKWGTARLPAAVRQGAVPTIAIAIVVAYGSRSYARNFDWANEGTLFRAALKVCPGSAKVQLNNGILERRSANWTGALTFFERARQIEPSYCEADFWTGLTLLNANRTSKGLTQLEAALDCPYVAAKSLQALNQAYMFMHARSRQSAVYMQDWARILTKANRTAEACELYEQLANMALGSGSPGGASAAFAEQAVQQCLASLQRTGSSGHFGQLKRCVLARAKLRSSLLGPAPPGSPAGLRAVHAYLADTRGRCRGPADISRTPDATGLDSAARWDGGSSRSGGSGDVGAADLVQQAAAQARLAHTALVHAVQSRHAADPHLQAEWATILVADGRLADAMQHYQAAGIMFTGQHAEQAGFDELMDLGLGRPMSVGDKAAASMQAFDAALQLQPDHQSRCMLLQAKCSALGSLRQQHAAPVQPFDGSLAALHRDCMGMLQQKCSGAQ